MLLGSRDGHDSFWQHGARCWDRGPDLFKDKKKSLQNLAHGGDLGHRGIIADGEVDGAWVIIQLVVRILIIMSQSCGTSMYAGSS